LLPGSESTAADNRAAVESLVSGDNVEVVSDDAESGLVSKIIVFGGAGRLVGNWGGFFSGYVSDTDHG
jgi:hypothetical protein